MGFFGLQVNVCGEAFANLMGDAFGIQIPLTLSSLIWGIVMSVIAIIGMEGLKIFDKLSVPCLLYTSSAISASGEAKCSRNPFLSVCGLSIPRN